MSCTGELELWRALLLLIVTAMFTILTVPAMAEWVARILHAHAIALTAWYRVTRAACRAYRRIHQNVMEETAE